MKTLRRLILALVAVLTLSPIAKAQLSAYVTPMFTGWGFSTDNSGVSAHQGSGGIGGGIFYNFPIQSRLTAGIDARGSDSFGSHGGDAFSASLRIGFVPHKVRLRPYFQIGGGVVSAPYTELNGVCNGFSCTYTTASKRATNGAALLAFGLDIRLTQSFDLRALEYGDEVGPYGTEQAPTSGFGFLSSGVVYHFRPATP